MKAEGAQRPKAAKTGGSASTRDPKVVDTYFNFARIGPFGDEGEILTPLVSTLSRFSSSEIDALKFDREHAIPHHVLAALGDLGIFGLAIPEAYGGAGLSLGGVCTAIAELARFDRSVATTVGLHSGLGTRGLIAFGSDALKERYLPSLAAGEKIAAFATTEEGAGSDLAAIRTTGKERNDKLLINGSKVYVTNGRLAEIITITASTPGLGGARRGHSLVLLEKSDKGLTVGEEEDKLGLRGSSTASVFLDDLEIDLDRIIGTPGKGMEHLQFVLSWGRTVMAAGCLGTAAAAIARTAEQVTTRVQFGKPIGSFEVVKQQVADMAALCFAMGAIVRYTCDAENDTPLLLHRSNAAKVFCSEGAWEIGDQMVQLFGGSGFIEETGVPVILRDARITRIFEGANDVLLCHAGTLEAAAPPAREALGEDDLGRQADAMAEKIAAVREGLRKEHGIRLMRRQRQLHRLGQLSMLQAAVDATVQRARIEGSDLAVPLATHFLEMAQNRLSSPLGEVHPLEPITAIADAIYEEAQ